ncbi:hypothetical protein OIU77_001777 [Salix suchowensis]|uniref:Uncharacterized protein n=1 Tax=Salix suchowensis TaxID=1278906 RepID=A0ABQ9B4S0_9ROSI|nr:hypothetical protein OIU77_001777 [Salix suchowensis]
MSFLLSNKNSGGNAKPLHGGSFLTDSSTKQQLGGYSQSSSSHNDASPAIAL